MWLWLTQHKRIAFIYASVTFCIIFVWSFLFWSVSSPLSVTTTCPSTYPISISGINSLFSVLSLMGNYNLPEYLPHQRQWHKQFGWSLLVELCQGWWRRSCLSQWGTGTLGRSRFGSRWCRPYRSLSAVTQHSVWLSPAAAREKRKWKMVRETKCQQSSGKDMGNFYTAFEMCAHMHAHQIHLNQSTTTALSCISGKAAFRQWPLSRPQVSLSGVLCTVSALFLLVGSSCRTGSAGFDWLTDWPIDWLTW